MNKESIHIEINRKRLRVVSVMYILLALVIFAGGLVLSSVLADTASLILKIVAGISALLLLLVGSGAVRQLNDKTAGITVDKDGIHDRSTTIACGTISWKQIRDYEIRESDQIILVLVDKPAQLLKEAKNAAIKRLLEQNIQLYKTPVVIESRYLNCTFKELNDKLAEAWKKFASKK